MIPEFFPRDRYYCVLDEQPDFLVPAGAVSSLDGADSLVVNPRCWFGWHGRLPPALAAAAGPTESLYLNPWIVWVEDPDLATLWPYWLGPRYAELLQSLLPGDAYGGGLPVDVEANLRRFDILVTPGAAEERRRHWSAVVASDAGWLERGWVTLTGMIPAPHIGALRRYYRYHTRMGTFAFGDEQTPGRYVAYDEPATGYFHRQLTRMMSDLARRVVVPSYSYLALYQGGSRLDAHTDREACEYTLTLCADATPDPAAYGAWPINLLTSEGPVAVTLGVGDALLFRGRYLPHWRDELPAGYTSSSVLFHYVDA